MIKLTEKYQKLLKTVFELMIIAAAVFMISGCIIVSIEEPDYPYDPNYPYYYEKNILDWGENFNIYGYVCCSETYDPVLGIHVTLLGTDKVVRTDRSGYFEFYVPKERIMTLKFEDVDGYYRGGLFKEKILDLTFTLDDFSSGTLKIYLEQIEQPQEDEEQDTPPSF